MLGILTLLEVLAIALMVVAVVVVLFYVRELRHLVAYAKTRGLKIRNIEYNDVYQIYSDFGFLNALLAGDATTDVSDPELRQRLTTLRKLLIAQLVVGLVVFFLVAAVAANQPPSN